MRCPRYKYPWWAEIYIRIYTFFDDLHWRIFKGRFRKNEPPSKEAIAWAKATIKRLKKEGRIF